MNHSFTTFFLGVVMAAAVAAAVPDSSAQALPLKDPPLGPPVRVRADSAQCCAGSINPRQFVGGANAGTPSDPIRCDQSIEFNGSFPEHARYWQLPSSRGGFTLEYEFYTIPDTMDIYQDGVLIFTTGGLVNGSAGISVPLGAGPSRDILVVVNEGDNSDEDTAWTYSISCAPEDDLTIIDLRHNREVRPGEVLRIEGKSPPTMPQLVARLGNGFATDDTVFWAFTCLNPHPRRKGPDRKLDTRDFRLQLPVGMDWEINPSSGDYFGGDAEVNVDLTGFAHRTVAFKIRGENPPNSAVISFILNQTDAPWYARYIAQHESREKGLLFNQFNPAGALEGQPSWATPDGWGVMKLDSKRGRPVSAGEIWNWQANVLSGLAQMRLNRKQADAYFAAVKRTYPDQYEPPPRLKLFANLADLIDPVDACAIQLYNGAKFKAKLTTVWGNKGTFISSWKFSPNKPAGHRWQFGDNRNHYVEKIFAEKTLNPGGVE